MNAQTQGTALLLQKFTETQILLQACFTHKMQTFHYNNITCAVIAWTLSLYDHS